MSVVRIIPKPANCAVPRFGCWYIRGQRRWWGEAPDLPARFRSAPDQIERLIGRADRRAEPRRAQHVFSVLRLVPRPYNRSVPWLAVFRYWRVLGQPLRPPFRGDFHQRQKPLPRFQQEEGHPEPRPTHPPPRPRLLP